MIIAACWNTTTVVYIAPAKSMTIMPTGDSTKNRMSSSVRAVCPLASISQPNNSVISGVSTSSEKILTVIWMPRNSFQLSLNAASTSRVPCRTLCFTRLVTPSLLLLSPKQLHFKNQGSTRRYRTASTVAISQFRWDQKNKYTAYWH